MITPRPAGNERKKFRVSGKGVLQALIFLVTLKQNEVRFRVTGGLGAKPPWDAKEWNMIHVNAAQLKGKKGVLRLFDIEGRIVFERPAEVLAGGYYTTEIYMNELVSGVYLANLVTEKDALSYKVMK